MAKPMHFIITFKYELTTCLVDISLEIHLFVLICCRNTYYGKCTKYNACVLYRGSYMGAHVLLNLLNNLGKSDKMQGLLSIL